LKTSTPLLYTILVLDILTAALFCIFAYAHGLKYLALAPVVAAAPQALIALLASRMIRWVENPPTRYAVGVFASSLIVLAAKAAVSISPYPETPADLLELSNSLTYLFKALIPHPLSEAASGILLAVLTYVAASLLPEHFKDSKESLKSITILIGATTKPLIYAATILWYMYVVPYLLRI